MGRMLRYWWGERSRCRITTPQGERILLSVPLCKHTDGEISYMHSWQHQHWMALVSAYGKTPYFDFYRPYIEPVYQQKYKHIDELNAHTEYLIRCFLSNQMPQRGSWEELGEFGMVERSSEEFGMGWKGLEWDEEEPFLDGLFEYGPEMVLRMSK